MNVVSRWEDEVPWEAEDGVKMSGLEGDEEGLGEGAGRLGVIL